MKPTADFQPGHLRSTVSLPQIAGWQLPWIGQNDFRVELPKLQRGFVWEPTKIMDLWDSILRGFPIGSIMVSTIDPEPTADPDPTERYWLLDGQQRATSIALGFYDPWNPQHGDPNMWSSKAAPPILWLDLNPIRRDWDVKMFFPYLVTQSHPWGYNQDGGVIAWGKRKEACECLKLGANYFAANLSKCFPWEAKLPLPIAFLLETANREDISVETDFWSELAKQVEKLPDAWKLRFGKYMEEAVPDGLNTLFQHLRRVPATCVHINYLTSETEENDSTNADDTSLLFVRLNAGGTVLGGEELVFSLFKSAFPLAKEAVEDCATGFMAPSKLFGLFVRLAGAEEDPAKLARPVTLRDFKKEIRTTESRLKQALGDLLRADHGEKSCEAARLVRSARDLLCGPVEGNAPGFCLPEAAATRSINELPEVFLALLFWLRCGGSVELGSEAHRRLLGCFTALCWFQPGNARARQESLREWVSRAGEDVPSRLWSSSCLESFFTNETLAVPVFPEPRKLQDLLLKGVLEVDAYAYENLSDSADASFWDDYAFLSGSDEETMEVGKQRLAANLMSFLNQLWPSRTMLLYAQRDYIRERFQAFGQWELSLKDTNCPWDWDHIYPSASGLHNVDPIYRDWHNTIGNLRVEGLSENRRDGCSTPTEKLELKDANGTPGWQNSFISPSIWAQMQSLGFRHNAIKDKVLAEEITVVIIKRMVSIYEEWHGQLRIHHLMDEIQSHRTT